jgi:hypothetical protein
MGGAAGKGQFSEDKLRQVIMRYEQKKRAALTERDEGLRRFAGAGWRPMDLQRVTGYSRETIRQALDPQAREQINAGRREATARLAAVLARDGLRPFVLPKTLAELEGPTSGTVTLPRRLDETGDRYDLMRTFDISVVYSRVMIDASSVEDLRTWIDHHLLVRIWPELALPPALRLLWSRRFPVLARRLDLDPWEDRPWTRSS